MKDEQLKVRVSERHTLTEEIELFRLRPLPGQELPAFEAGAHVEVDLGNGLKRAYSLCSDPNQRHFYEIAVKLERAGRGGSRALYALAQVGSILTISPPRNLFALAEGSHSLLLGGGIGLTPLIAMAHRLHAQGAEFTFVTFTRSSSHLPFRELLRDAPWRSRVHHHFDDAEPVDIKKLVEDLPTGARIYCCGPEGFMQHAQACCSNHPSTHWHEERFGGALKTSEQGFDLLLDVSNKKVRVAPGQSMIAALREYGVHVDTVCEQGICGSCVARWKAGDPSHNDQCLSEEERGEYIALCCADCRSPSLTLEL